MVHLRARGSGKARTDERGLLYRHQYQRQKEALNLAAKPEEARFSPPSLVHQKKKPARECRLPTAEDQALVVAKARRTVA